MHCGLAQQVLSDYVLVGKAQLVLIVENLSNIAKKENLSNYTYTKTIKKNKKTHKSKKQKSHAIFLLFQIIVCLTHLTVLFVCYIATPFFVLLLLSWYKKGSAWCVRLISFYYVVISLYYLKQKAANGRPERISDVKVRALTYIPSNQGHYVDPGIFSVDGQNWPNIKQLLGLRLSISSQA